MILPDVSDLGVIEFFLWISGILVGSALSLRIFVALLRMPARGLVKIACAYALVLVLYAGLSSSSKEETPYSSPQVTTDTGYESGPYSAIQPARPVQAPEPTIPSGPMSYEDAMKAIQSMR